MAEHDRQPAALGDPRHERHVAPVEVLRPHGHAALLVDHARDGEPDRGDRPPRLDQLGHRIHDPRRRVRGALRVEGDIEQRRLHVGAAHEPFSVHVRVEELRAERFERTHRVDRREWQGSLPTVNHDPPTAAVHGRDNTFDTHGLRERTRKRCIDGTVSKERRTGDDGVCAESDDLARTLDAADATADAAREPATNRLHQRAIVAPSSCRVEIDQLHARKRGELDDPRLGIRRLDCQSLALNELYDMPVLEVDGGN